MRYLYDLNASFLSIFIIKLNKINTFSGSYTVALQSSERPSSVILCSNGKQGLSDVDERLIQAVSYQ